MDLLEKGRKQDFAYPNFPKWFFGVGALIIFSFSIISLWAFWGDYGGFLIFAILIVIGCLGLGLWYRLQGIVCLDDQGITLIRFGQATTIHYDEIAVVKHHNWDFALTIESCSQKIKIEKQLISYPVFFHLVAQRIPSHIISSDTFPLEVHTRRWIWIFYGSLIVLGLVMLYEFVRGGSQASWLLFISIIGIVIGSWRALTIPRMYVFGYANIEVIYFSKKRSYKLTELKDTLLKSNVAQDPIQLQIIFANDKIQLEALIIDHPLEELGELLNHHYFASRKSSYNLTNNEADLRDRGSFKIFGSDD